MSKVRRGEHIIPKALGGVRTIKNVCGQCNSGVLSDLDKELCTASPLAIVAADVLGRAIGLTWDVDHAGGNVLLEGQPSWGSRSMTLWPQMTVTHNGVQFRGDYEELQRVGQEDFQRIFVAHMRRAYSRYKACDKGLFFCTLRAGEDILAQYRYPPRIFAKRRIRDFKDRMTFLVGYADEAGKRRVLHAISNWDATTGFKKLNIRLGSEYPIVRQFWDRTVIIRALTKLGINLLRDTCEKTDVNSHTFAETVGFVLGKTLPASGLIQRSGFVWPDDLAEIHRSDTGHAFRLVYDQAEWTVLFSFFGGRVCAVVRFPRVSNETWATADVSTPIASETLDVSGDWSCTTSSLILPLPIRVEWDDPSRIVPSAELLNVRSRVVEEAPSLRQEERSSK